MTVERFVEEFDNKYFNIKEILFLSKHGIIMTGVTRYNKNTEEIISKGDLDDCLSDFDAQFAYDEDTDKFIPEESIYTYNIDHVVEMEDNSLRVFLKKGK